jgi:hypothetical protein
VREGALDKLQGEVEARATVVQDKEMSQVGAWRGGLE